MGSQPRIYGWNDIRFGDRLGSRWLRYGGELMLLDLRDLQLYWCGTCNTGNLMQDEIAVIGTDKKTTICKECKNKAKVLDETNR